MSSGYAPPPPPPAPMTYGYQESTPETPPPHRTWLIVLSIVAGFVLLIILFVAGLALVLFAAIRSSEPYQRAVKAASHDARAVSLLGAPVEARWYVTGSENVSGGFGKADLAVPVTGSRRKGTIYVVATKSAGHWRYATLELRVEGQPGRVNLLLPLNLQSSEK